jgi:hypothetical protein
MEKMRVMYKIVVAIAAMVIPSLLFAGQGDNEKSKKIIKSFAIDQSAYVEIENKYGDIDIETWNKDSIRFEIIITVQSDKSDDLEGMLSLVKIDLKATNAFVLASTNWSEEVGLFKKGILKINQEVSSNSRYNIHYKIKMPATIDLSIKNKFGNIFMMDYTGKLTIDQSYGDFRAHHITNFKQFSSKYGKVKIKEVDYGRINLQSVRSFDIDESIELDVESSSSEISLTEINTLNIVSSHDEIVIKKIDEINGSLSMSDLSIATLNSKFQMTTKYGSLKIGSVAMVCERINIESNKTDIELNLPSALKVKAEFILSEKSYFSNNTNYVETVTEVDGEGLFHSSGKINGGEQLDLFIKTTNGYLQVDSE